MTDLNKEYLKSLTAFASSLGMASSTQVGYNLPIDMLSNIPYVDAPETETLGFDPQLDTYRQFAGPAGLAGQRIISLEAGAVMQRQFQSSIPEQLYYIKRSVIGGVNSFKLHGMPYSGAYPNTTWPGFVPFSYVVSEMHNRLQPSWDFYRDSMDYTARVQHAMQTGVAKVDLAFWLKRDSYVSITSSYQDADLAAAGYAYEYLSPDNFVLPDAYVEDQLLAPKQQGFKALIVRANDTLTLAGVETIAQWANEGLTIVFSGGIPFEVAGTVTETQSEKLKITLAMMQELPNVHIVANEGLARSLASLGIRPRLTLDDPSDIWYSRWREDENEIIVFLYYDATGLPRDTPKTRKSITFASTGAPYFYNAWTGEQTPLDHYSQTIDSTTLSLELAGDQTTLIAFRKHEKPQESKLFRTTFSPSSDRLKSIRLAHWNLTIESWAAPHNINNINGTLKTNETFIVTKLLPWNKLDVSSNLTYVAGRGYYTTTFSWPPPNAVTTGAIITLSPILHTAVLSVNGHRTPPLDVTAPRADISAYLVEGVNSVEIVVSTLLGNALLPRAEEIRSAGAGLAFTQAALGINFVEVQEYGLVGEVVLQPY